MENINISSLIHLNNFAQLLHANGFQIITQRPKEGEKLPSWFYFSKDNKIGYVQSNRDENSTFSTVHKSCRECGTGFRMTDDYAELTIENALNAFAFAPNWAFASDRNVVKKYESAYDYVEKQNKQWAPLNYVYEVIEPINLESHANN